MAKKSKNKYPPRKVETPEQIAARMANNAVNLERFQAFDMSYEELADEINALIGTRYHRECTWSWLHSKKLPLTGQLYFAMRERETERTTKTAKLLREMALKLKGPNS